MKMSYALEVIVVVAVGLGFARWHVQDPVYSTGYSQLSMVLWLEEAGNGFFAGAALAGLLGLAIEVALRRTPKPWGPGRWAWSVVGLFLVSRHAINTLSIANLCRTRGMSMAGFVEQLLPEARVNLCHLLLDIAPYILIAVWLSRVISGPAATQSDGREWAGRLLAALIIAAGIAVDCLSIGS